MKYIHTLVILLFVLGFSTFANAQNRKSKTLVDFFLVEKDKPSVYMTFEKSGKAEPLHQGESYNRLWLRLRNNTRANISFCHSSVDFEYGNIAIHYDIEENTNFGSDAKLVIKPPKTNQLLDDRETHGKNEIPYNGNSTGHACLMYDLSTGKSVLFSIPKEYLIYKSTDFRIKIRFNYEWEKEGTEVGSHPLHFVSFSFGDLPFNEQKKLSF